MNKAITESVVERAALNWLRGLGYEIAFGLAIAPAEPAAERADYKQIFLFDRLQTKLLPGELRMPGTPGTKGLAERVSS
jgi:type I restriction enzyme R subunit